VGSTIAEVKRTHAVKLNREEGHSVIVPDLKMGFELPGVSFADTVRTVSIWIFGDPAAVKRRWCPDR
jgi:hypothetical protein